MYDIKRLGEIAYGFQELEKQPHTWETNKQKATLLREARDINKGSQAAFHSWLKNGCGFNPYRCEAIIAADAQAVRFMELGISAENAVVLLIAPRPAPSA